MYVHMYIYISNFSLHTLMILSSYLYAIWLNVYPVIELQPGAAGFQLSNPPVLQCMLLKASLNVFSQTSMAELTTKSRILTGYLELLVEKFLTKETRASPNG